MNIFLNLIHCLNLILFVHRILSWTQSKKGFFNILFKFLVFFSFQVFLTVHTSLIEFWFIKSWHRNFIIELWLITVIFLQFNFTLQNNIIDQHIVRKPCTLLFIAQNVIFIKIIIFIYQLDINIFVFDLTLNQVWFRSLGYSHGLILSILKWKVVGLELIGFKLINI